ncbi:MAG: hypothetical protein KBA61_05695 [Spirochaetes bacterium]|nr:hypothetical protein [Spirochaetota bacterium]
MKRILAYRIRQGELFRDGVLEFESMTELNAAIDDMSRASEEFGGSLSFARFWRR